MPERKAVGRRQARVREIMHTLPPAAQEAIRDDLEGTHKYATHELGDDPTARHRQAEDDSPTASIPVTTE
jgi:phospholipid/cholesterol/gamma-HCH transport system ATP-binding protein